VKVIVRLCCVVGCEQCEGYCSTVLRCGVRAVWNLLFHCAVLWGASTVKVIVRLCCVVGCEQCEIYCSTVLCCGVRAVWNLLFHCSVLWGASTVTFTVLAPYNSAPHNRYQPHPAEPMQHTTCSNTRLGLLKMGIMMPETCWEIVKNKHLTVASCWFSLSLHKVFAIDNKTNYAREMKRLEGNGWKISYMVTKKFQLQHLKVFTLKNEEFHSWMSSSGFLNLRTRYVLHST